MKGTCPIDPVGNLWAQRAAAPSELGLCSHEEEALS